MLANSFQVHLLDKTWARFCPPRKGKWCQEFLKEYYGKNGSTFFLINDCWKRFLFLAILLQFCRTILNIGYIWCFQMTKETKVLRSFGAGGEAPQMDFSFGCVLWSWW